MDARKDRLIELLLLHAFQARPDRPYTLASGGTSPYYLDCKPVSLSPEGLNLIGGLGYEAVRRLEAYAVGGLAIGADPIACAIAMHSFTRSRPLQAFLVRSQAKDHGTGRWIEGAVAPGTRVVVVEDVVTTGGSTLRAVERAREAGLVVEAAVAVVDREAGGREALTAQGVELYALVTLSEVIARRDAALAHAAELGV